LLGGVVCESGRERASNFCCEKGFAVAKKKNPKQEKKKTEKKTVQKIEQMRTWKHQLPRKSAWYVVSPKNATFFSPLFFLVFAVLISLKKRLNQEWSELASSPPENILACPLPSNILEWHFVILGAIATPYEGCLLLLFFFHFFFFHVLIGNHRRTLPWQASF
jgi:hypothetical protein